MANVRKYLQDILDAIYGEEVRGSIHDAIEAMNEESTNAEAVAISSRDSAKHSAEAAKSSETNAKASETAAKTSETNAKASETAAKASETAAKASETAAKTSETNAKASETAAKASENAAKDSENAAKASEDAAASSESAARTYSMQAFEYKHDAQESAEAAYQYEQQCEQIRDDIGYPIDPKGTVTFANLPSISSAQIGWMYNISDDFTTTSDFEEGAGKFYSAGTEVYANSNHKWSVMAGPGVTGIKGNKEQSYRKGQINLTPANIGAPTVEESLIPRAIVVETDLNDVLTPGVYSINSSVTTLNLPYTENHWANLEVYRSDVNGGGLQVCHEIISATKVKMFYRVYTGSPLTWTSWQRAGAGHEIINEENTSVTQREKMQFIGNVEVTDDAQGQKTVVNIEGKPDHLYETKEDMLDDIANIGEGEMAYTEEDASDLMTRIENLEKYSKSHVGMIIHSTTLNTMAKVIEIYGGTTWIQHSGYMLRGATSGVVSNSASKTGGSDDAIVPYHNHSVDAVNTSVENRPHTHAGTPAQFYGCAGSSASQDSRGWAGTQGSTGAESQNHIHTVPSHNTNYVGASGNTTNANIPNYKSVYIWERTE